MNRIAANLLTALIAVIGVIVCFYAGMFIRTAIDPSIMDDRSISEDYVEVTHEDGTQTFEKVGTLCPAGTTEVGVFEGEAYRYRCDS